MTQQYVTRTTVNGEQRRVKNGIRNLRSHTKPFVAWDGEGISDINPLNNAQSYMMLLNSNGGTLTANSVEGLTTDEVLQFIVDEATKISAIHLGFALNYDINMWLRDLSLNQMERLYRTGKVFYRNYNLEWIRGKSLVIRRYQDVVTAENRERQKPTNVVTIYDCFPFFQMSFVKTLKEWQPFVGSITPEIIERIHADKLRRSDFHMGDVVNIIEYCREEVRLLADLMEEFRRQCVAANIVPDRWDGPGAIATALFKRHKTKLYRQDMQVSDELTSVNEAAQYAFTGGRIELVQFGHCSGPVWSYDIRSAYPSVIRHLPDLSNGVWHLRRYRSRLPQPARFGLYKVTVGSLRDGPTPGVLPTWARLDDGSIHYRDQLTNWYWSPEYALLHLHCPDKIKVHESWEFEEGNPDFRPFAFVDDMFIQRAILKKANNPAQLILKLGLNSLYGKTVQQVGRPKPGANVTIPPYHQLEWAGFITSAVRARMAEAAYLAGATFTDPAGIISFETDGLISATKIPLPLGPNLGDWEEDIYDSITYVQPGVYFLRKDGDDKTKTRGFDALSLSEDKVLRGYENFAANPVFGKTPTGKVIPPHIDGTTKGFVTFGRAGKQLEWRSWVTLERSLRLFPHSKRVPDIQDMRYAAERLCRALIPAMPPVVSAKFKLKFASGLNDLYGVKQEFGSGFIALEEGAM